MSFNFIEFILDIFRTIMNLPTGELVLWCFFSVVMTCLWVNMLIDQARREQEDMKK